MSSTNKTLIGKNGYLFLINDSGRELEIHCNNLDVIQDKELNRYNFNNYLLTVFPNKSLIYKDHLPDSYSIKYRPGINIYTKVLKNKIIDTYHVLKNQGDTYYKTDTHINMKGSYIVYKYFIDEVNKLYHLHIKPKHISILSKNCILTELPLAIGDLLWKQNLGEQVVENPIDTFYYSNDVEYIYCTHVIQTIDNIKILSKDLIENNSKLNGSVIDWNILSEYILYQKNESDNKYKVLIFYDSLLIPLLSLYLNLFPEVYMIKNIYNHDDIKRINPDYVFEFRVERFLF